MMRVNIAEFKNKLSMYLAKVEAGEVIEICKRNVRIAKIFPFSGSGLNSNKTQLGCGKGSVTIKGDLTRPAMSETDWNMLQGRI